MDYPATERGDLTELIHGLEIRDPYRWLEDAASPAVQAWTRAQDEYARARLARLPGRQAIAARVAELLYLDSTGVPRRFGGRYFYRRRHANKEKAIVYWRDGEGAETVLLDPNQWSDDGATALGEWSPSWDGSRVAYTVRQNNSDEATLYVVEVASGRRSSIDVIEGAKYAFASWTPDGAGFYYTWEPTDPQIESADRPGYAELRFHELGTDPKGDEIVHDRLGDSRQFQHAQLSRDGHWLIRRVALGWSKQDVYYRDLRSADPAKRRIWHALVVGRDAMFSVAAWRDRFYVQTTEGGPRGRMFEVDPATPGRENWKEIVPERRDATLEGFAIVGERLVLNYLKNACSMVEIRELGGALVHGLRLPALGTVGGPFGNPDEDDAYFSFESFTVPTEIHALSVTTGQTRLWSRLDVPIDPSPYLIEQVWFASKDETQVPMFIVRRRDLEKDQLGAALLTGYGGFAESETPVFSPSRFAWLEQGGLLAIPNLRGGGEYGEDWHRAGMGVRKQNVFDDFIAAAEFLIRKGYTSRDRLAIAGGSNGGLLIGAVITQRPDLFRVALCAVPLLDMVRYHRVGAGPMWMSEYGSPDSPDDLRALFAYSPYHNVKPGERYPSLLIMSADNDDRVDPMHARKFTAALQAATSGGPVLLRIERNAGHAGADLVQATVNRVADEYAFALSEIESRRSPQPLRASAERTTARRRT